MKKQSQKDVIIKKLLETGSVSRNWAIRVRYITRLSGLICDLNQEGWEIVGEDTPTANGLDYTYRIVKSPFKKIEYKVDGQVVSSGWKKTV